MSTLNDTNRKPESSEQNATPARKRNYQKPAFRHERVFETMALRCGKVGTQGQCQLSSKTS